MNKPLPPFSSDKRDVRCNLSKDEVMDEISSMIRTGEAENRIKAVRIFRDEYNNLPSEFSTKFIKEMGEDPDPVIKEIISSLKKNESHITAPESISNARIVEKYTGSLETVLKRVTDIASLFDLSHVTAQALKQNYLKGTAGSNSESDDSLYSKFVNERAKVLSDTSSFPQISLKVSPIEALSEVIRILPDRSSRSKKTRLLSSNQNIENKLDEIILTDREIAFNIAGYELLYTLERMMRDLIHQRIIHPNENNLSVKIPTDVLEGMKKRKETEEKSPVSEGLYELIEYCDFTDLKKILEKGRNHESFSDIFSIEEMKTVYSKLGELDPIRKKIAHSRPLTRKEFERLRLYATDILDRLKK
jgi:hypothetical protein